ncbi:MAG: Gfo/Idh/MocA family oxidoreductase [Victivallales bacterium]|nr:Gfo/Idh/MocA family oxidoreductase [Victivallales bacterium]
MKKRCVVVGVGNRAHCWISGIVNYHPDTNELVGLCDLMPERCEDINEVYKTNAAVYTDYDRMLNELKPDLVVITSPESCHAEHIIKAFAAGCEVACEKPLCVTLDDAHKVLAAEKDYGRKVKMCFNYRHIPLMSKIKEVLLSGEIGSPVSMDLTWYLDYRGHGASYFRRWHRMLKESGGLLVTKACHHFDLANWWMGDVPKWVFAQGRQNFFGPGKNKFSGKRCSSCSHAEECEWYTDVCVKDRTEELSRELGYRVKGVRGYVRDCCPFGEDVDIYDTMGVSVEYRNGGMLNYSLNASVPFEGWNLAINCTNGRLESKITDNKPQPGWQEFFRIVGPDGKVHDGGSGYHISHWPKDYVIHVMPHDKTAYELKLPNIAEGHGGGDMKLYDLVYGRGEPETDPLGILASAIDGARSTAIGAGANVSIKEKRPIDLDI